MTDPSSAKGPRDIFSIRPFKNSAREYYRKGFEPFPLPAKEKNPPPKGATGHNPKYPINAEKLDEWMDDKKYDKSNVGIKLTEVWVEHRRDEGVEDGYYSVIGIDVDNYVDHEEDGVEKMKLGGEQLLELESQYGKLPDTWISSARADGVSGIRFFLAPMGLQWRGKAADSIDVIQPGHRFAVVWPSWHPKGGQYLFTQPGQAPDGTLPDMVGYRATSTKLNAGGYAVTFQQDPIRIPEATSLPLLPDKWIDFLTRDRTEFVDKPMNMDVSVSDLEIWAKKRMRSAKACKRTVNMIDFWKKAIDDDPSSHDKVLGFHWQFAQMGLMEGHAAVWSAIKELDEYWIKAVVKAGKRGPSTAAAEIFRSKINSWRKARYEWDEIAREGLKEATSHCKCNPIIDRDEAALEISEKDRLVKPPGVIKDVEEYENSDWGRSEMYLDMYTVERVKCIGPQGSEVKWYFWELDAPGKNSRGWVQDNDLAIRLTRGMARIYRMKYEQLLAKWREMKELNPEDARDMLVDRVRPAKVEAERIGNRNTYMAFLNTAQSHEGVRVSDMFFDSEPSLLGFDDGVVVLERTKPWVFRQRKMEDYVTKSVGLPFRSLDELMQANDPGIKLLTSYLEMFIPDPEIAEFVQMVLGYALFGSNPDRKLFFFYGDTGTGKSTIVESFVSALGEYGGTSNMEIFQDENGGRNPELLKTRGKRVVQLPEFGNSQKVSNDVLKRLASEDRTSVRDNYAKSTDIVEFQQTATFIGPTNGIPKIDGVDKAVKFRTVVVPFDQHFNENAENKDKTALMKTIGRAAILAWALEGWNLYVAGGQVAFEEKHRPKVIQRSTDSFLGQMSAIGEFLEDYIEITGNREDRLTTASAYDRYQIWAEREGSVRGQMHKKDRFCKLVSDYVGSTQGPMRVKGQSAPMRGWYGVKMSTRSSALKNSGLTVQNSNGEKVEVGNIPEQKLQE